MIISSRRILRSEWLARASVILALSQIAIASEAALFPCPDCDQNVSRRAVSCPKCGCPGDAIHKAVRQDDEKKRPKRLATVSTDKRSGAAVLIRHGDSRFLVMDYSLLAVTNSLVIKELGTENSISYSEPELASGAPLLRFKVIGEPRVQFLTLSEQSTSRPPTSKLTPNDELMDAPQSPSDAVAAIDETGAVAAVQADGQWAPVHSGMEWTAVKPAELRTQIDLLARAKESAKNSQLSEKDAAELTATKWLTPYLKIQSTALLQSPQDTSAP